MKKIVVITGGAGGMGLATAKIVGKDHFVLISDVREDRLKAAIKELKKSKVKCDSVVTDVTSKESVKALISRAKKIGPIASVIHTAGVSPLMGSPELIIKINAIGTINVAEAFYEAAEKGSSLINVASMAGHTLPGLLIPSRSYRFAQTDVEKFLKKMVGATKILPGKLRTGIAYGISKNFVIWYSKKEAKKFGQKGARILSVSPGTFETEMGKLEKKSGSYAITEFSALKRVGKVEEIAEVLHSCQAARPATSLEQISFATAAQ